MKAVSTPLQPRPVPAAAVYRLRDAAATAGPHVLCGPLTLQIEPGKLYGLLGHNGSGKSSLLKVLARQIPPSAGTVLFDGELLDEYAPRAFARRVAYLPQQIPESPGLSVAELVALGRYPWHGALGRFSDSDTRHVDEALALTGMQPLAPRLLETLSGGERQRAWLAMLLAQDSDCLLLDEPISALDVSHQIEVMELIRSLCRKRTLTVVAVLHDINIAARFCDELIALRHGQPVAHGTPEAVVRPDCLERIYGIEMGVIRHPERADPVSYVV